ncbi:serine hydrolase domain-containing protein [Sandarakinorhabdus sp.]|uniref:serine hydrolase domain-containing protein n=1 Tax=Sandarakinorhabdus sp. TaxID=1916663 RepID=UPI00286D8EB7|nr:serine hydrolase domain-containing protein [Sandarakinorhabdus sp.]
MPIDRRLFLAGSSMLLSASMAGAAIIAPRANAAQQKALAAIAALMETHRRHHGLPAMGMVVVDGADPFFIQSGTRDYRETSALAGDELWQIGSISKSFIALICLQLQAEGKMTLADELRQHLPEARLPGVSSGGPFTIQGLLDHTTGLPDFAPAFPADDSRLWRGFSAGSHWSYSNTGYDLVGAAIERIEGKPLYQVIEARVCKPLGMAATRGAIQWRDRTRFPASYGPVRPDLPALVKTALAPAPWVDANLGAGSVASTLADMGKYLGFLIAVGQGKGAPLLTDGQAGVWLASPVVQDPANVTETYGLGLMHREQDGRKLLHHTGGMVSFSSSFHVDAAAGTGAFASCAVGGINYRPRAITAYAARAMRLAREGQAPPAPPAFAVPAIKPEEFAGTFSDGSETISIGPGLTISGGGDVAALEPAGPDMLVTSLPALADFALVAVRQSGGIAALDHGSRRFVREGTEAPLPVTPPALLARQGWYQSDDPWMGGFAVVARGDRLYLGGTDMLTGIGDDVWRLAQPEWHPERLRFAAFIKGIPQIAVLSGRVYERRDR